MNIEELMWDEIPLQEYSVNYDLVLCIDLAENVSCVAESLKSFSKTFYDYLGERYKISYYRKLEKIRVKVISFNDTELNETDFFCLPKQSAELFDYLNNLESNAKGNSPKIVFKALESAFCSKWNEIGAPSKTSKQIHAIGLFTKRTVNDSGNEELIALCDKLYDMWGAKLITVTEPTMNQISKRMQLYIPESDFWIEFAENFDATDYVFLNQNVLNDELAIDHYLKGFINEISYV